MPSVSDGVLRNDRLVFSSGAILWRGGNIIDNYNLNYFLSSSAAADAQALVTNG